MDFDDLKRTWDECDQKLASSIRFNARRLRSIVTSHAEATANRPSAGGIDYTMPVVLMQQQLRSHRIVSLVRAVAVPIRDGRRAGRLVSAFEAMVTRFLRRMRSLRS
jgi:hypothetical protein